jgi:hypothetical protein
MCLFQHDHRRQYWQAKPIFNAGIQTRRMPVTSGFVRLETVSRSPLASLAWWNCQLHKRLGTKHPAGAVENQLAERLIGSDRHRGARAMIHYLNPIILALLETFQSHPDRLVRRQFVGEYKGPLLDFETTLSLGILSKSRRKWEFQRIIRSGRNVVDAQKIVSVMVSIDRLRPGIR